MAEGKGLGHQTDYYQVWDQRVLGDERFVEKIDERIRAEREIEVPGPRATFANLLQWTAECFGVKERELLAVEGAINCAATGAVSPNAMLSRFDNSQSVKMGTRANITPSTARPWLPFFLNG
jgi:hypothetical protein